MMEQRINEEYWLCVGTLSQALQQSTMQYKPIVILFLNYLIDQGWDPFASFEALGKF